MQATLMGDLIYLNPFRKPLPNFLAVLRGFRQRELSTTADLQAHLVRSAQRSLIFVELKHAAAGEISSYLSVLPDTSGSFYIFVCESLDPSVFQLQMKSKKFVALRKGEQLMIGELARLWQQDKPLFSRRNDRQVVQAPVMVKKSNYNATSPTGSGITTLKDGQLQDFSVSGARVMVRATSLKLKDFISLMYMSDQGQWVCVEAQLRWIQERKDGFQELGVQFLAMSA